MVQKTREASPTYQIIAYNHASFHLWSKENLLNHEKVLKYSEHNGLQSCFSLLISLLTVLIVKNSHILAGMHFMFLKKCRKLEKLSIRNLDFNEKIGKLVIK